VLIALLVCLIPTTIGGLLSAIGIAGMDRVLQRNVLAMSGRAVEAAGDVDTLLLDKTGTITLGNRQATEIVLAEGVAEAALRAAYYSSLPTKRPKAVRSSRSPSKKNSGVGQRRGARGRDLRSVLRLHAHERARLSRRTRDPQRRARRRSRVGRARARRRRRDDVSSADVERIARAGGTPLLLAENEARILGVRSTCATSSSRT
jgi:K+-transporting ATPase ATPase B chain